MRSASEKDTEGGYHTVEEKRVMQEIWKEVLDLDEMPGVEESFFDLGGNSFIANKACMMFEEKTGRHIEIADFFEKDTISTLLE